MTSVLERSDDGSYYKSVNQLFCWNVDCDNWYEQMELKLCFGPIPEDCSINTDEELIVTRTNYSEQQKVKCMLNFWWSYPLLKVHIEKR